MKVLSLPPFGLPPTFVLLTACLMISGGECADNRYSTCQPLSRVCSETNDAGVCTRYTNTFRCIAENPEKDRCQINTPSSLRASSGLEGCQSLETTCSVKDDAGLCLETQTTLTCDRKPSGIGLTVGEPKVTFSWRVVRDPNFDPEHLDDGCLITSQRCTDSIPREIPLDNAPGETVTANPSCWEKTYQISCPSSEAASSCKKLEDAGCRKISDIVCERTENGHCVRWSASYRCSGTEINGDDIVTDEEIQKPGDVVEDASDCDRTVADANREGLTCEAIERQCVTPGNRPELPCRDYQVTLRCTGQGGDGCAALKKMTDGGRCLQEGDTRCEERNPDGTCRRESAVFLCGESVAVATVKPASLIEEKTVDNWTDDPVCHLPPPETAKPLTTTSTGDELSGCVKTSALCSEGPGIRFVNGLPEWRSCWATTETWTCTSSLDDECRELANRKECKLVSERCADEDDRTETGGCRRPTRVYRCRQPGTSGVIGEVCDGQTCIAGVCRPTDGEANNSDFINGLVQLEIGRQAASYGNPLANRFFQGSLASCKDRKGASSCCKAEYASDTSNAAFSVLIGYGIGAGVDYIRYLGSPYVYDMLSWSESTEPLLKALYGKAGPAGFSPSFSYWGATVSWSASAGWGFNFSPGLFMASAAAHFVGRYTSCNAEDVKTSMAKGQRLCHFVGTRCEKKVAGLGCVETSERYVCFNSRLARIIHEQGRAQLQRGWGSADNPDAKGFTLEELEKLDFGAMDLSEFTADIIRELSHSSGLSEKEAIARANERIAAMIKQELAPTAPVAGSIGTRAGSQPTQQSTLLRK